MTKNCHFLFFLLALIAFTGVLGAYAQSKAKRLEIQKLKDSTISHRIPSGDYQLYFRNINKLDEYINEGIKTEIKRAENKEDFKKALFLMEEYVSNFGIKNFYKDTYYIWHLGQLYERFGNMSKAKALYKLVLKHHRADIKKVQLYYDSLTYLEKDYWVDLGYYYQLVDFRKDIDTLHPPHSVLLNMGPEVNSKDADYGPSMSADKKMLLFTSRRNKAGIEKRANEDLFYTEGDEAGYFYPAKSFGNVNTEYNEGSPCLSKNGDKLYFVRCNAPDGNGNCDIYTADKKTNELTGESEWTNVKNFGSRINGRAWDSQPSLSHTEDTLFFASDRLGGFGMSDIWFTYKQKDGDWAIPENLGPIINTRGNEVSPYYHPKFDVLYYSSNGHPLSFGDFDIFKVRRMQGKWEEPRNIGPLVNGKGSEYYFTIDAQSKDLYYARSEQDDLQNLDLYSFPLPMEAQPTSYTKLAGKIVDSTSNQALKGIVSIIDLDHGIEVAPKFLRPDGSFEFDLINNNRYLIIIQGDDFFSLEKELNIKNDTLIRFMTKIIDIQKPLVLDRIEFENGKAEILDGMKNSLDLVMKFLIDNPSYKLTISGHTDSDGNHADNMLLSAKRAEAIRSYFIEKGKIEPKKIQANGYGDTKPLRIEITPEDKRINRRVEFEVKRPGD
ncbi:MAG: OmpA family protein [Cytophagales bacterium]